MVTKVLVCSPEEYGEKEQAFIKECYTNLNKDPECDDTWFYMCTRKSHDGNAHYFEFTYDRWID